MEYQSDEGKGFIERAKKLAGALNISIADALKKLHTEAANKMFRNNSQLREWEELNFPNIENKKDEES